MIETTLSWDEVHDISAFPATKLFKEFSKLYYEYVKSNQPLPPTLRMVLESPEKPAGEFKSVGGYPTTGEGVKRTSEALIDK